MEGAFGRSWRFGRRLGGYGEFTSAVICGDLVIGVNKSDW